LNEHQNMFLPLFIKCVIIRNKETNLTHIRLQVLMVESMKMIVCRDVSPHSLVEIDLRFRGDYCLHHQDALKMEIVCLSDMLVST
jgi:hypothetical protein